jgi:UDP:flavonoid glycosyltransferase YjiC (YdhE family)
VVRSLFCSLASPGFLFPAIGLARRLASQGHDVAFVTGRDQAPLLHRLGVRRLPRGPRDGDSFQVSSWHLPVSAAVQVKHIEFALESFPADLVVGQPLTLGAVIAAERAGLPLAVLGLANYVWPTGTDLLERPPRTERERRSLGLYQEMMNFLNAARRLFGLAGRDDCYRCSPLLGDLYLLQSVAELAGDPHRFPEPVRFVGSCLWEPGEIDAEIAAWIAEDDRRPIVYVQCGRSFGRPSQWAAVAGALAGTGVRVAAAVGRTDGTVAAPADWLVRGHLPQGQILPHARAVITGGNSTALLGALTQGLPLLILPAGGEQQEAAESCTAAGAALSLELDQWSSAAIREALRLLLEDAAFARQAQRLSQAFKVYNGLQRSAGLLEALGARAASAPGAERQGHPA